MTQLYDIPFKYKRYHKNKNIPLNEIKVQFNNFYCEIKNSNELNTDEWTKTGKNIKSSIEREVTQRGNKKSIYVDEYVQFIFGVSYMLYDKFDLSQDTVAEILDINPSKYAKLGIYPNRCWKAYTKLNDDSKKKSLIPDAMNSIGIQIAEGINKEVQAVYACYGFVGISNDLDFFANISATDKKVYILTRAAEPSDDPENMLAYPRYLFATANCLEGIPQESVAGKLKEEIIKLLNMKDNAILYYSDVIQKMLLDEKEQFDGFRSTGNVEAFNRELKWYRRQQECIADIKNGYYGDDYFEELDLTEYYGMDFTNIDINDEDELLSHLVDSSDDLKKKLVNRISYDNSQEFDEAVFKDYKMSMLYMLINKYKLFSDYQGGICKNLVLDEKIRLAAVYWILKTLGLDNTTESCRDNVLEYLESKKLLGYVDSLNNEAKTLKNIHIRFQPDNYDISEVIKNLSIKAENSFAPMMVYIDTEAYVLSKEYVQMLLDEFYIVLVVRDKTTIAQECDMKPLNQRLKLYMKESYNVTKKIISFSEK